MAGWLFLAGAGMGVYREESATSDATFPTTGLLGRLALLQRNGLFSATWRYPLVVINHKLTLGAKRIGVGRTDSTF